MKESTDSVFVQLASVAALAGELPPSPDVWLSASELQRLDLISSGRRAAQFMAGHWLLRRMSSQVFGGDAHDWSMLACADHAPTLTSLRSDIDIAVHGSLSHCGDFVAAAIANFPIGIDIECPSKRRDLLAIAAATFSAAECAELSRVTGSDREARFYLYWTLKEAAGKREGHGLRPELSRQQEARESGAHEAEAISWQFSDCSVALAGKKGMAVRMTGLPDDASTLYWRIEPAAT